VRHEGRRLEVMKGSGYLIVRIVALTALVMAPAMASVEAAGTYKIIHSFGSHGSNGDGESPYSGLTIDTAGNLYGTTSYDTYYGAGVAFELTPTTTGQWKEHIIHVFDGSDGRGPYSSLTFDLAGNLYGTTVQGGSYGCGTVFELSPGGANKWKETVLYSFPDGSDGCSPSSSVALDSTGNLYGTTSVGGLANCDNGLSGCGTVFELTPTSDGSWKKTLLHEFTGGRDGGVPRAGVVLDGTGNLYGTASAGGIQNCLTVGCGTVYELVSNSHGRWKFKVLHQFTGGNDGAGPFGGLTLDSAGNVYGTASSGGKNGYPGVVFELQLSSTGWKERVLHAFTGGNDGSNPFYETLIFDTAGNIYGTTEAGGPYGNGVVFELMPSSGARWREKILHSFGRTGYGDGANPYAGVILDSVGHVYGTTLAGGHARIPAGTVFEATPQTVAPVSD